MAERSSGQTALIQAAQRGDTADVQALLAKGVNVNLSTEDGVTALMEAALHGHPEIVQALLAKVSSKNNFNNAEAGGGGGNSTLRGRLRVVI